jgi:exosortase
VDSIILIDPYERYSMEELTSTQEAESGGGWLFLAFTCLFGIEFHRQLWDLMLTSYHSNTLSYILFIPLISLYVLNIDSRAIFSRERTFSIAGLIPLGLGIAMVFLTRKLSPSLDHIDYLTLITLSMVLIWIGGFWLSYGLRTLRAAAFPMLFLFFMVPVPDVAMDKFISILHSGSAMVAYGFLKIAHIPAVRDGFAFHILKTNIVIAPECSGLNSAIALLITGLLAGYFFLRTGWARFVLFLLIVPIAILKNGFRIAVLSVFGVYVDKRVLQSELSGNGGLFFFVLALVLLFAIIALLRKAEGEEQQENGPALFVAEKKKT